MDFKRILRPKSPKEMIVDFAEKHSIKKDELKDFLKNIRKNNLTVTWIISCFLMSFGLAIIINSILALDGGYFWFPIQQTKSMLAFINVFWAVIWFVGALSMFIYGIVLIVNAYDY